MNTDDLIAKLENMADRKTRYHYGIGDYWNALGDAADALKEWRQALRIIAGEEQCLDNLMSDKDVARAALAGKP